MREIIVLTVFGVAYSPIVYRGKNFCTAEPHAMAAPELIQVCMFVNLKCFITLLSVVSFMEYLCSVAWCSLCGPQALCHPVLILHRLLYSNLLTNLPYGIFSEQKALTQL